MDNLEILREERKVAWAKLKDIHSNLIEVRKTYHEVTKQYEEAKKLYESIDHDLALIDGRTTKVEPAVSGKRRPTPAAELPDVNTLTQDQIAQLLEQLAPHPDNIVEVPTPEELALANDLSMLEENNYGGDE